jgi:hypothetical protein
MESSELLAESESSELSTELAREPGRFFIGFEDPENTGEGGTSEPFSFAV